MGPLHGKRFTLLQLMQSGVVGGAVAPPSRRPQGGGGRITEAQPQNRPSSAEEQSSVARTVSATSADSTSFHDFTTGKPTVFAKTDSSTVDHGLVDSSAPGRKFLQEKLDAKVVQLNAKNFAQQKKRVEDRYERIKEKARFYGVPGFGSGFNSERFKTEKSIHKWMSRIGKEVDREMAEEGGAFLDPEKGPPGEPAKRGRGSSMRVDNSQDDGEVDHPQLEDDVRSTDDGVVFLTSSMMEEDQHRVARERKRTKGARKMVRGVDPAADAGDPDASVAAEEASGGPTAVEDQPADSSTAGWQSAGRSGGNRPRTAAAHVETKNVEVPPYSENGEFSDSPAVYTPPTADDDVNVDNDDTSNLVGADAGKEETKNEELPEGLSPSDVDLGKKERADFAFFQAHGEHMPDFGKTTKKHKHFERAPGVLKEEKERVEREKTEQDRPTGFYKGVEEKKKTPPLEEEEFQYALPDDKDVVALAQEGRPSSYEDPFVAKDSDFYEREGWRRKTDEGLNAERGFEELTSEDKKNLLTINAAPGKKKPEKKPGAVSTKTDLLVSLGENKGDALAGRALREVGEFVDDEQGQEDFSQGALLEAAMSGRTGHDRNAPSEEGHKKATKMLEEANRAYEMQQSSLVEKRHHRSAVVDRKSRERKRRRHYSPVRVGAHGGESSPRRDLRGGQHHRVHSLHIRPKGGVEDLVPQVAGLPGGRNLRRARSGSLLHVFGKKLSDKKNRRSIGEDLSSESWLSDASSPETNKPTSQQTVTGAPDQNDREPSFFEEAPEADGDNVELRDLARDDLRDDSVSSFDEEKTVTGSAKKPPSRAEQEVDAIWDEVKGQASAPARPPGLIETETRRGHQQSGSRLVGRRKIQRHERTRQRHHNPDSMEGQGGGSLQSAVISNPQQFPREITRAQYESAQAYLRKKEADRTYGGGGRSHAFGWSKMEQREELAGLVGPNGDELHVSGFVLIGPMHHRDGF